MGKKRETVASTVSQRAVGLRAVGCIGRQLLASLLASKTWHDDGSKDGNGNKARDVIDGFEDGISNGTDVSMRDMASILDEGIEDCPGHDCSKWH